VSSFSVQWLRLREPVDRAARTLTVPSVMLPVCHVVDLGAGTGANLRYLAPLLGGKQNWLLVEQDPVLLSTIPECLHEWADHCDVTVVDDAAEGLSVIGAAFACRVRTQQIDLASELHRLVIPPGALVTASALLDLGSERWLTQLIKRCAQALSPVWFALTYNGQMQCDPPEPEDELVRSLFNEHQRTDKGFGPALGPAAVEMTRQILMANGYHTSYARSDWRLTPEMRAIQHGLVKGWFDAVRDYAPETTGELNGWLERRRAHIDGGVSTVIIGHADIVGWQSATGWS
jgi:hypothetical protein